MIGLMFFGAIGLWGIIAIALSLWAAKLAGAKWRWLAALVLMPLVFFAPVADEIVAYPQMQALCDKDTVDRLMMSESQAQGLSICYTQRQLVNIKLWPSTISLKKYEINFVDVQTKAPVLSSFWYEANAGYLQMPNGSSGGTTPLLLGSCNMKSSVPRKQDGTPTSLKHLNLTKKTCPNK